jgi:hypothetical protein
MRKVVDVSEYFGAIGNGPKREMQCMIGKLISERVLCSDPATGYQVPRADATISDLHMTGTLIYRSVVVDGNKLQIQLHPALLVLLTVNFLAKDFEWSFLARLLGNDLLDVVSPRSKFSYQRLHLLDDALSRFPDYSNGFLEILSGFQVSNPYLCLTPHALNKMLCDPVTTIEAVLKRTRVCAPADRVVALYAALLQVLGAWTPQEQSELYTFWFGSPRTDNFGITDAELVKLSGVTGLLQSQDNTPRIDYNPTKENNNGYSDDDSDTGDEDSVHDSSNSVSEDEESPEEDNSEQDNSGSDKEDSDCSCDNCSSESHASHHNSNTMSKAVPAKNNNPGEVKIADEVKEDAEPWHTKVIAASTCSRQLRIPELASKPDDVAGMAAELEILFRNTLLNQKLAGQWSSGATYHVEH